MAHPRQRISYQPASAGSGGGGSPTVGAAKWGPDFGGTDGDQHNVAVAITQVSTVMQFTSLNGSKDSWVDDLAVCATDVNHNGTPLEVEGITATKKTSYIGWDVSGFPINTAVTVLTLRLVLDTAPLVANQTIDVHLIPTGSEGWTEADVRCSNNPAADGAAVGSFTVNTTDPVGTVYTITLNATARTRLANRMGVSTFSLMLNNASIAGTNCKFEDKDTGAAADRPKITFTATKTLL